MLILRTLVLSRFNAGMKKMHHYTSIAKAYKLTLDRQKLLPFVQVDLSLLYR